MCKPMSNRDRWLCAIIITIGLLLITWSHTKAHKEQQVQAVEETEFSMLAEANRVEVMDRQLAQDVERQYKETRP